MAHTYCVAIYYAKFLPSFIEICQHLTKSLKQKLKRSTSLLDKYRKADLNFK